MKEPPHWTAEQLEVDRLRASAAFTKERLEEPLEDYLEAFDEYQGYIEELLEATVDLSDLDTPALDVLGDPRLLEAFRYLAAPPISSDDYKVLADVRSFSLSHLNRSPADVQRLLSVVRQVLDRRRFAWVVEGREPTEGERRAAVVASAALMAASRTQTGRRTKGKIYRKARSKLRSGNWVSPKSARVQSQTCPTRRRPTSFVAKACWERGKATSSSAFGTIGSCRSSARYPIRRQIR